jgi:hypothetical protein
VKSTDAPKRTLSAVNSAIVFQGEVRIVAFDQDRGRESVSQLVCPDEESDELMQFASAFNNALGGSRPMIERGVKVKARPLRLLVAFIVTIVFGTLGILCIATPDRFSAPLALAIFSFVFGVLGGITEFIRVWLGPRELVIYEGHHRRQTRLSKS